MTSLLDIVPGDSLGQFKLGTNLFTVINLLRTRSKEYTDVKVAWDDKASCTPTTSNVNLYLTKPPLTLTFEPKAQRLSRIELAQSTLDSTTNEVTTTESDVRHWIRYKGTTFGDKHDKDRDDETTDVVKVVRTVMGPTYGNTETHEDSDSRKQSIRHEMLCYPGVAFGVTRQLLHKRRSELSRVIVTPLPTPPDVPIEQAWLHPVLLEDTTLIEPVLRTATIQLERSTGKPSHVELRFRNNVRQHQQGQVSPITIKLGETTTEDVMCDLGSPIRSFWKEDDRMSIHSRPSSIDPSLLPNAYFWSYPQHGLTFMFDPIQHFMIKMILHSNLPGQVGFVQTSICPWILKFNNHDDHNHDDENESNQSFTLQNNFKTISNFFLSNLNASDLMNEKNEIKFIESSDTSTKSLNVKDTSKSTRKERPMILDRTADGFNSGIKGRTTEIHGFPGIAFEVTTSGHVETVWLF
ncbi:hypothetical protein OIO90_005116 [Microbotryomycetes sp. JL221]|nr:hypothetical protein OIO90_005116 [Microbotryomycetes sp. JL221]